MKGNRAVLTAVVVSCSSSPAGGCSSAAARTRSILIATFDQAQKNARRRRFPGRSTST